MQNWIGKHIVVAATALLALLACGVVLLSVTPGLARAQAQTPDSTMATPRAPAGDPRAVASFVYSPFDSINAFQFWRTHPVIFDQFLEYVPGYFVSRAGPMGADAIFSRYGIGFGRGVVYLGHVPLDDPQSGRTPLYAVPKSAVGGIDRDENAVPKLPMYSNIEGAVQIKEPPRSPDQPFTLLEGTTGNRGVRERRVRFSSAKRSFGLDFTLDEFKNRGYNFDATGALQQESGSSSVREQNINLRGDLPVGDRYMFAFRRFQRTFDGAIGDPNVETRNSGAYGYMQAQLGLFEAGVYQKGFTNEAVDSVTTNETTGVNVLFPAWEKLSLGLSFRNILYTQDVGGGTTNGKLNDAGVGASGTTRWGRFAARYALNYNQQFDHSGRFGGFLTLASRLTGGNSLALEARRGYRMPALGELFLPAHQSGTTTIVGNSSLVAESSLEGAARLYTHAGVVQNELRGSALFIDQPILYQQSGNTLRPENASNQDMFFIEDRLRIEANGHRLNYRLEAAAAVAFGDRVGYFSSVPRVRAQAELTLGSELFKGSSSLYYSAQYVYTSARNSRGVQLEPFGVLNMQLRGRLINAFLYMRLLNVLDEKYITVYPYLMTPRTFVFGIVWAVFS